MKVKQLVEMLTDVNPDALVTLAGDEEGNSFGILYEVHEGFFDADENPFRQFGYINKLTPELKADEYVEEDVSDGAPAVCLWPTSVPPENWVVSS